MLAQTTNWKSVILFRKKRIMNKIYTRTVKEKMRRILFFNIMDSKF
jgi:hypothetical protein